MLRIQLKKILSEHINYHLQVNDFFLNEKKQCIICKYLDKFERIIKETVERGRRAEYAWLSLVCMACVNKSLMLHEKFIKIS